MRPASPGPAALPRGNFPIVRPLPAGEPRGAVGAARGTVLVVVMVVGRGSRSSGGSRRLRGRCAPAAPGRRLWPGVSGAVTGVPSPPRCPVPSGAARGCHRCPSVPSPRGGPGFLRSSAELSPCPFPPLAGCRAGCGAVAGVPSPRGLSRVPPAQLGAVTGVPIPSPPGLSRLRRGGRNAEFLCCVTRFVRGLERLCADSGGFVIF